MAAMPSRQPAGLGRGGVECRPLAPPEEQGPWRVRVPDSPVPAPRWSAQWLLRCSLLHSSISLLYRFLGCLDRSGYRFVDVRAVDSVIIWQHTLAVRDFKPCVDHAPEGCEDSAP